MIETKEKTNLKGIVGRIRNIDEEQIGITKQTAKTKKEKLIEKELGAQLAQIDSDCKKEVKGLVRERKKYVEQFFGNFPAINPHRGSIDDFFGARVGVESFGRVEMEHIYNKENLVKTLQGIVGYIKDDVFSQSDKCYKQKYTSFTICIKWARSSGFDNLMRSMMELDYLGEWVKTHHPQPPFLFIEKRDTGDDVKLYVSLPDLIQGRLSGLYYYRDNYSTYTKEERYVFDEDYWGQEESKKVWHNKNGDNYGAGKLFYLLKNKVIPFWRKKFIVRIKKN